MVETVQFHTQSKQDAFCNPKYLSAGWYSFGKVTRLKKDKIYKFRLLKHDMILYITSDDKITAQSSICPHMGADLSQGKINKTQLTCAFHNYQFDSFGNCFNPKKECFVHLSLKTYPVQIQFGLIWIYLGKEEQPLPEFSRTINENLTAHLMYKSNIKCHPHMISFNGFDVEHYQGVHSLTFLEEPILQRVNEFSMSIRIKGVLSPRLLRDRILKYLSGKLVDVTLTSFGGSVVLLELKLRKKIIRMFFVNTLIENNESLSHSYFLLPNKWSKPYFFFHRLFISFFHKFLAALILMGDLKILNSLKPIDFQNCEGNLKKFKNHLNKIGIA